MTNRGGALILGSVLTSAGAAQAKVSRQRVETGGTEAVFLRLKAPKANIILMTGGSGALGISENGDIWRGRRQPIGANAG